MKNNETTFNALEAKERVFNGTAPRWTLKKGKTQGVWKHFCGYSEEWTTVHFEKETKRGFTFRVFFAGKYTKHFISRSDCNVL